MWIDGHISAPPDQAFYHEALPGKYIVKVLFTQNP